MSKRKSKNSLTKLTLSLIILIFIGIIGYFNPNILPTNSENLIAQTSFDLNTIPDYTSEPYVIINNNVPEFNEEDLTTRSFEKYSDLDFLGRCGTAFANLSIDTMPTANEEREN